MSLKLLQQQFDKLDEQQNRLNKKFMPGPSSTDGPRHRYAYLLDESLWNQPWKVVNEDKGSSIPFAATLPVDAAMEAVAAATESNSGNLLQRLKKGVIAGPRESHAATAAATLGPRYVHENRSHSSGLARMQAAKDYAELYGGTDAATVQTSEAGPTAAPADPPTAQHHQHVPVPPAPISKQPRVQSAPARGKRRTGGATAAKKKASATSKQQMPNAPPQRMKAAADTRGTDMTVGCNDVNLQKHTREFYFLHVRVVHSQPLDSWVFDVFVKDVTEEGQPVRTYSSVKTNSDNYIVFHAPGNTVMSPADDFPWIDTPVDLFGHKLHIEVFGAYPSRTRVVDTYVHFGAQELSAPAEPKVPVKADDDRHVGPQPHPETKNTDTPVVQEPEMLAEPLVMPTVPPLQQLPPETARPVTSPSSSPLIPPEKVTSSHEHADVPRIKPAVRPRTSGGPRSARLAGDSRASAQVSPRLFNFPNMNSRAKLFNEMPGGSKVNPASGGPIVGSNQNLTNPAQNLAVGHGDHTSLFKKEGAEAGEVVNNLNQIQPPDRNDSTPPALPMEEKPGSARAQQFASHAANLRQQITSSLKAQQSVLADVAANGFTSNHFAPGKTIARRPQGKDSARNLPANKNVPSDQDKKKSRRKGDSPRHWKTSGSSRPRTSAGVRGL